MGGNRDSKLPATHEDGGVISMARHELTETLDVGERVTGFGLWVLG